MTMANDRQFSSKRHQCNKSPLSSPINVPSTSHKRFEMESDDDEDDRNVNVAIPHRQYHDRIPFRKKKDLCARPQSVPTNLASSALRLSDHEKDDSQDESDDRPRRHSLATEIEIGRELQEISDRFLSDFQVNRSSPVSQSPASRLRQWWAGSQSTTTTTTTATATIRYHTSIDEESNESSS